MLLAIIVGGAGELVAYNPLQLTEIAVLLAVGNLDVAHKLLEPKNVEECYGASLENNFVHMLMTLIRTAVLPY
jgi:DNA-binding Lrp family transcriptional regulator